MDKTKTIYKLILICFFAAAFGAIVLTGGANFAYAATEFADAPTTKSVTAVVGYEISYEGAVTYRRGNYVANTYAKDIKAVFDLNGASSYKLDVTVDGYTADGKVTPATAATVAYDVKVSGKVEILLTTYSGNEILGSVKSTVFSDVDAPLTPAEKPMDKWLKNGEYYDISLPLEAFRDELSGRGDIYYRYDVAGEEKSVMKKLSSDDALTLVAHDAGTLTVYYFDNAYNCKIVGYGYDKFDKVPPSAPIITVTPNVDPSTANGYAAYFTVSIDYPVDAESGLADKQYYTLITTSGEREEYVAPFELTAAKNYEIRANATDNAGNVSETVVAKVKATDFDRVEPTVDNVQVTVDIRKSPSFTVTLSAYDNLSGIAKAYIDGTDKTLASAGANDAYTVSFDAFDLTGFVIKTEDRVGNVAINRVALNYFGETVAEKFKRYGEAYRALDKAKYTEDSLTEIENCYLRINTLIEINGVEAEFNTVFAELDEALNGTDKFIYVIDNPPRYLSGALTFKADTADFDGYVLGDEIKLVMSSEHVDGDYVNTAGFKEGFYDCFTLKIFHNDREVGNLNSGIKVSVNMPVGFYERRYALVNIADGETVEIATVNNKIEFTLHSGGSFALVISGKNTPASNAANAPKTVSVFGHRLSYGAFFGSVFGVLGGVIIIIVVLIVIRKKRG